MKEPDENYKYIILIFKGLAFFIFFFDGFWFTCFLHHSFSFAGITYIRSK